MVFPAVFDLTTLNGTNGFAINSNSNSFGQSVSGIGDINADGIDDMIIGTYGYGAFIFFGTNSGFPAYINTSWLDGTNGFMLSGTSNYLGYSVSGVGDVNADGIDDVITSDYYNPYNNYAGQSYVIFGSKEEFNATFNLANLNGTNGFSIIGINQYDQSGFSVSGAGDVNGDNITDIIIGAPQAMNKAGQSYVVFGNKNGFNQTLYLNNLNGTNGFSINGINQSPSGDQSGYSVSGVGDVNFDGIDDIIIGAPYANHSIGQSYVVYGSKEYRPLVNLASLNGKNGFTLKGINQGEESGGVVSGVGDINADGIDDFAIGSISGARNAYLIFGNKDGFTTPFNLNNLNGNNGFIASGSYIYNPSVSEAGDVNNDGITDIVINGGYPAPNNNQSYVIFGSKSKFNTTLNLNNLNGINGFAIDGYAGTLTVSGAGDINADGIADILIGAPQSYVIFGQNASEVNNELMGNVVEDISDEF